MFKNPVRSKNRQKFPLKVQSTHPMDEEEAIVSSERWSHLLKPIRLAMTVCVFSHSLRDLAENWNIDLANELKDYLDELNSISYSVNGMQNLKFAEGLFVHTTLLNDNSCVAHSRFRWCLQ